MTATASSSTLELSPFGRLLDRWFRFVLAARYGVLVIFTFLTIGAVYYAVGVQQDNSLDRLVVASDPEFVSSRRFAKVFPGGEYVILLAEAPDPYTPEVLAVLDKLELQLAATPRVSANSALGIFRRARAGFTPDAAGAAAFKEFVTGTDLFKKQGLIGDGVIAIPLIVDVHSTKERQQVLAQIDKIVMPVVEHPAPLVRLVKVGQPYVDAFLDGDTRRAGTHFFPLFMVFVVLLNFFLYRSWRTLVAFLLTLGVSAAMTVGYIGVTGGVFSLVSSVVPMTVLITCTATLVYLHSRFVERPEGVPVDEHQLFALRDKFLACTASLFATSVGFAALMVSKIRPIREMGIWVAVGLLFTWVVVFTLFPALQKILRTPTEQERKSAGQWFTRLTEWLPRFSYRFRWLLVVGALTLCGLGAVSLFGLPHLIAPMKLETNAIEYIPHKSALYQDTKRLERTAHGLSLTEVWVEGASFGVMSDAETLAGLCEFQSELEKSSRVGAVVGPSTVLSLMNYLGGKGDALPKTTAGFEPLGDTLEARIEKETMLQRFFDAHLQNARLQVVTPTLDYAGFTELEAEIQTAWKAVSARHPQALQPLHLTVTGLAVLQAKVSFHLVPTLVQSFGLTVVIIFGTFLVVFRNGAARIMAMIPSLFAILVMFAFMRTVGMSLNIATILIASTVLGTSENDQIHFFYHFLEHRKAGGTVEESLRYTLRVAGRAIFFATMINAGGFLAFVLAELPPMRQFGILSSLAFVLSMVADFTALPAALWLVFRARPDKSSST